MRPVVLHGSIRLSPAVQALIDAADADAAGPSDVQSAASADVDGTTPTPASSAVPRDEQEHAGDSEPAGVVRLVLKGCSVTESGVRHLFLPQARCAHSLQHLDVSSCNAVTLACLRHVPRHSALHTLQANGCSGIVDLSLELPKDCPLREISARECSAAMLLQLSAPALRRISLHASPGLRAISLQAPRLEELLATQCIALTSLELRGAAATAATRLRLLNLRGAALLPSAALHAVLASAQQLTRLDISGCSSLGALVMPGAATLL